MAEETGGGFGGFDLSSLLQMAGPALMGFGAGKGNMGMMAAGLLPMLMKMGMGKPGGPGMMAGMGGPLRGNMPMPNLQSLGMMQGQPPQMNPFAMQPPMGGGLGFRAPNSPFGRF